jgi:hypothetical protein
VRPIASLCVGGLTDLTRWGLSVLAPSWASSRYQPIRSQWNIGDPFAAKAEWAGPQALLGPNDGVEEFAPSEFDLEFEDIDELTPAHQQDFRADLARDLARLAGWTAKHDWAPLVVPRLQVVVSQRYRISRSLVPAWYGHAGRMEFPAWRVMVRKAAIAHELVHVFFPNANRFLAEGLAVYLQSEIGGNPAFPNFGRPLHEAARESMLAIAPRFARGNPKGLDNTVLANLDAIATPGPLELQVGSDFYGEEPRGQARIYPIAGSFAQFLVESRGMTAFRALYLQTPLMPLQQNAGSPGRWKDIYGLSLVDLEGEWKSLISDSVE